MSLAKTRSIAFLALFVLSLSLLLKASSAQTPDELASTYAPVLHFAGGESFYPTSVDYIINSSVVKLRGSDGSSVTIDPAPSKYTLGVTSSSDMFLDNKLGTLNAITADYASNGVALGFFVYVHVVAVGPSTVVQYWLFYAYNNGPLNDHQGDIEVVEVFLDDSGVPIRALYSQHGAGENAAWSDVEKSGTHPIVYVALGSHANYFRPYQGKLGIESDTVGSDGKTILAGNLQVELLGEPGSHSLDQSWLDFAGRWGFWGSDEDVALGRAGPLGPVFNQNGIRWSDPESYLSSTLNVDGNYFILSWMFANVVLLFLVYVLAYGAWKVYGIVKLHRRGGLRVVKFLKGPGGIGLVLGIVAVVVTAVALVLPWYVISASSVSGPLAGEGGVTLMTIDGLHGIQVNLFMDSSGDSSSGFGNLFTMAFPFALFFAVGLVLLALDVIGITSGRSLGSKLIWGAIGSFLPLVLIYVFIMELPALLPWASQLVPGQSLPVGVEAIVRTVAGNPIVGSASQVFPVVGVTSVSWGFGVGVYLFVVAAVLRVAGGVMMMRTSKLEPMPAGKEFPRPDEKSAEAASHPL